MTAQQAQPSAQTYFRRIGDTAIYRLIDTHLSSKSILWVRGHDWVNDKFLTTPSRNVVLTPSPQRAGHHPPDANARAFFEASGFHLTTFVGGCSAFMLNISAGRYFLITAANEGGIHPHDTDTLVDVGLFDHAGPVEGATVFNETWDDALDTVAAISDKYLG